ncbi:hypothetical protein PFISCL1PPCAC_2383, partial [Pristionchus fissidentatus]
INSSVLALFFVTLSLYISMPNPHGRGGRGRGGRQHHNHHDNGGRRFDEYVHDEQHPNPLETAARLRREREQNQIDVGFWFCFEVVMYFVVMFVLATMLGYHQELHRKNDCAMTYIYRPMIFNPISVPGNTINKYQLLKYHEGYRDESTLLIDIPVLFVPGSSGSAKQIRSLGTTILNMTSELREKFPYRFVFFACDFDEEFSFLSGATLMRQRDFVVQSIETILRMYASHKHNKLLLIGHSFGGTILYSLPAHRSFKPEWMDLVITLGAPITGPPFKPDYYMEMFYENSIKAWKNDADELRHVTMISYSGGLKDFMVPDHLAKSPYKYTDDMQVIPGSRDTRVIFRPSWSLRDVGCEVDHNCLAWCNQLVRHISSLVISYGKEWKVPKDGKMKDSRQVVKDFYAQYTGSERAKPARREWNNLFNNSLYIRQDQRRIKMTEETPYVSIDLDVEQYDLVVNIRSRAVGCPVGINATHADLTFRSIENLTTFSIQEGEWMNLRIMPTFLETSHLKGTVRIGGTPGCEYEVASSFDITATLYRRLMDSTTLPFIVYFTLFLCAIVPMARSNRIPPPFDYIFGDLPYGYWIFVKISTAVLVVGIVISLRSFVERNFATYLIWIFAARLVSFLISLPLQPVIRGICSLVESLPPWIRVSCRVILASTGMSIAVYNINFAFAFFLFLFLFKVGSHSKNGLCLIIFTISVLVAVGLAGNVRDGPAGIFERSLFDKYPQTFTDVVSVLFYECPHPLLFSFISLVFSFLINTTDTLEGVEDASKERIVGVFYCLLGVSIMRLTNLESMAIATAYYILIFESYKEYKGVTLATPLTIG